MAQAPPFNAVGLSSSVRVAQAAIRSVLVVLVARPGAFPPDAVPCIQLDRHLPALRAGVLALAHVRVALVAVPASVNAQVWVVRALVVV